MVAGISEPAIFGNDTLQKIETLVAKQDQVLNHDIRLIAEKTGCTPESARETASELAQNPEIIAVIGPSCLSENFFSTTILTEAGMTIISPYRPDASGSLYLLLLALEDVAIQRPNGTLLIPRLKLQEALEYP